MRKLSVVLLCAALLFGKLLFAQSQPATILWRISGNGLQKPSYLYGTMHLTDQRIFNIGDSMYKAIENSEGFAIEMDPDNFTPLIIDEAKKAIYDRQRLKDVMGAKEFKKYGKTLAKKFNKNENDITTADVLNEKNKWIAESYKTGKMQTFLDAYLFDVARRQGKWTGGVEDLEDQENLVNYLIDESDIEELAADEDKSAKGNYTSALERLITVYVKNDLDGIEQLSDMGDSLQNDKILVKRNRKMAMRMDSLSHQRSMVFAVGAAHLPGSAGLIALLKAKGFTMTPVFSSKKIQPAAYKVRKMPLLWHDVKDEAGLYTASMPGKPGDMALYGVVNMKMYFDVFNSTLYMTAGLRTPYNKKTADSIMGAMSGYYFGESNYNKGKSISINNVAGKEFASAADKYTHGYLLYNDGVMYIAIGMAMKKKDTASEASINKFLHSFTINQISNIADNNKYITYANAEKAYSIDVPAEPRPGNEMVANKADTSTTTDLKIVVDPISGGYFFFGTNEAAQGFFIANDSTTFVQIRESQKARYLSYTTDTIYMKDGHRVMELAGIMAQAPLMTKAYYHFRGNRWYALVALYDPKKEHAAADRFFSSFKLLDYMPSQWKLRTASDATFSVWLPAEMKSSVTTDKAEATTTYRYNCLDTTTANNYSIIVETFSKYFWQSSDSALMAGLVESRVRFNDSLLFKKAVSNGDAKGIEIVTLEHGSANAKRTRYLLNDSKMYTIFTVAPAQEIYSSNNNRLFDEFRFAKIAGSGQLYQSKASLLLSDLSAADSATREAAASHLRTVPFTQKDLPLLHEALLKKYEDDRGNYSPTKSALQKVILDFKDSTSYNFAKEHYAAATGKDKNIMLQMMLHYPTSAHFNDIKNLLLQQPLTVTPEYAFVSLFADSMPLAAAVLPDLLPLLKDTIMASGLARLSNILLDSGYIQVAAIQPYQQPLITLAQQYLKRVKADADDYDYGYLGVLNLLAAINDAPTNAALQAWTTLKQIPWLQMHVTKNLMHNKQPINPLVWQNLAAAKATRVELYDTLVAYKKATLFPIEYLSQKSFAESIAYTSASDDDEPAGLTYLTQKQILFKGRQARFYFYKVAYGSAGEQYYKLACAGPFAVNVADISTKHATGSVYYDAEFDPSQLPVQIDALIKQTEEWFKWNYDDKE